MSRHEQACPQISPQNNDLIVHKATDNCSNKITPLDKLKPIRQNFNPHTKKFMWPEKCRISKVQFQTWCQSRVKQDS